MSLLLSVHSDQSEFILSCYGCYGYNQRCAVTHELRIMSKADAQAGIQQLMQAEQEAQNIVAKARQGMHAVRSIAAMMTTIFVITKR